MVKKFESPGVAVFFVVVWFLLMLGQYVIIRWEQWRFKCVVRYQASLILVFGSLGQGKSLLFSWLVNRLPNTYTNFWHKKKKNKILLLDYLDIRGKSRLPKKRAYYFVDEVNLYFRGVEYEKNKKKYSGVEDFCALARHFDKTVLFSVQRPNQLWVAIRAIPNLYIKVKGIHRPLFLMWKKYLEVETYEDIQLADNWAANTQPYQKHSTLFGLWSSNDYDEAKKRLNIKTYRLFLDDVDFANYDTKFFKALLPILNKTREWKTCPPNQIPVPNTLRDVVPRLFFDVSEKLNPPIQSKPPTRPVKTKKTRRIWIIGKWLKKFFLGRRKRRLNK